VVTGGIALRAGCSGRSRSAEFERFFQNIRGLERKDGQAADIANQNDRKVVGQSISVLIEYKYA
jgi:hypothetical protein